MLFIAIFTLFPFAVGVELLPPDDEFCLGSIANWTCTVNGNAMAWIYNTTNNFYGSNDNSVIPLGSTPFRTGPTIISGGVSTSMATANLSSNALNGTRLVCSDGGTNSANVSLNLKGSSAATSAVVSFDETSGQINVTWSGAICVPYYRVIINNAVEDTVSGTSFSYTPQSPDIYFFQLSSIDYFGREIDLIPDIPLDYPWIAPTININVTFVSSIGLMVSFEDNNIGQPPVNLCIITLNDDITACQINETHMFPIMTDEFDYTYDITVGNVVGSISQAGVVRDLIVPTIVLIPTTEIEIVKETEIVTKTETVPSGTVTVTSGFSATGDPVVFAIPFIILGVLIILSICWIVLRICWKRKWHCPRIWRSSFWLIFFCYDCCTYNAGEKERNAIGLQNPNVGGEKGNDTSL